MVVLSVTSRLSGRIAIVVNTAATEKNNRDAQEATMNKEPIVCLDTCQSGSDDERDSGNCKAMIL
jgi:hypothetical protein